MPTHARSALVVRESDDANLSICWKLSAAEAKAPCDACPNVDAGVCLLPCPGSVGDNDCRLVDLSVKELDF